MLSLVVSTIVFFVASFLIKRRFDAMDLPKGFTRSLMVFSLALAIAYCVAAAMDWVVGRGEPVIELGKPGSPDKASGDDGK